MDKNKLCKKLLSDKNIVIVSHDYYKRNKLRVYNSGGRMAYIYVGNRNASSEIMSEGYAQKKYCNNYSVLRHYIDDFNDGKKTLEEILLNKEFRTLAKEAFDKKYTKKSESKESSERNVETKIMRKFMPGKNKWITIDMEVQCPTKWFKGMKKRDSEIAAFSKKEKITEQPRFDIITFSKHGIGIVELKANNQNYYNMHGHYSHMKHILNNKTEFLEEIRSRIDFLRNRGIIDFTIIDKYYNDIFNNKNSKIYNKIWCGFLFVGGGKEGSKGIVKRYLENVLYRSKLKFLYCDNVSELDFNNMVSYERFMKS